MQTSKKIRLLLIAGALLLPVFADNRPAYEEASERRANDRQPHEKVMNAIGVRPGMVIGEIGAGRGRYTLHLSQRVGPRGKVFANDIDSSALAYLRARLERNHIRNVETILGRIDHPLFPESSLDLVIMVWVFHHLDQPVALLKNLLPSLKPGAPVVILDPDPAREGERDSERFSSRENVEKEARAAGFELMRVDKFLPRDLIFVLRRSQAVI